MGSIDTKRRSPFAAAVFAGLVVLFFSSPLLSARESSLTGEISRLEKTALNPGDSRGRYDAFLGLAKLHRLSGDNEGALKACDRALAVFPGDSFFLLERGRLLVSLGEYAAASSAVNALLAKEPGGEFLSEGRYLAALIEAFKNGNTGALVSFAAEAGSAEFRSGIYYTLWKLTAAASWKNRLSAEFPQSPEAKIAAAAPGLEAAPTPLWVLFPGRNSIAFSAAGRPAAGPEREFSWLQTGLFGSEENARAMGERLRKAGFEPMINRRSVNGGNYWAVSVDGGADMNATILRLKDADFEAFPIEKP